MKVHEIMPAGRLAVAALVIASPLLLAGPGGATADDDQYAEARAAMVRAVAETTEETAEWIGKTELEPRVMEAMGRVPRHLFVPPDLEELGYLNRPLPIGYGQTISQPYIVALMTDLLEPGARRRGVRARHRVELSGGRAGRAGGRGLHGGDRAAARGERHGNGSMRSATTT